MGIFSPRASSRFNHAVEAKRVEDVFFCKNYAEFKNQNPLVHKLAICLGIPQG